MKPNYYPGKPPEEQPESIKWADKAPTREEIQQILADHEAWLKDTERARAEGRAAAEQPHDLRGAVLDKADLRGVWLERADLRKARLQGADLHRARLLGADLREAWLEKADLSGAELYEADLCGVGLERADLREAGLERADLRKAILWRADLRWAKLVGADLREVVLIDADLREALLRDADLREARLKGADLRGAELRKADLREAWLWGADLRRGMLWDADLRGAGLGKTDLRGADLKGAWLGEANVTGVRTNRHTKFLGVRGVDSTHGSAKFRDVAKHNEYLEEMRQTIRGRVLYRLWAILADCGRTPWAWIAWCVFFAFGFAAVFFYGLGIEAFKTPGELPKDYWTMLYYSVVTFTTLGFGDVTPITRAASLLVMAEVIVGYIMLGGLISIFATKLVARRG